MTAATAGWLTLDQAAEYTGYHRETVRRAAIENHRTSGASGLRGTQPKVRGHWRFKAEDLDRWVRGEPPARIRAA